MRYHNVQLPIVLNILIVLLFDGFPLLAEENKTAACYGTWEVVDVQIEGKSTNEGSVQCGDVLVLTKNEWIAMNTYNETVAYRYALTYDSDVFPLQFAYSARWSTKTKAGKVIPVSIDQRGIVDVIGDKMRICMGDRQFSKKPSTFSTEKGDGLIMIELRRKGPTNVPSKKD